jgi:hypothetical protein
MRDSPLVVFFWVVLADNVMFSLLFSIPAFVEGNIVYHISVTHKFASNWCCQQWCVICASNSIITMKLIEVVNQMDHVLILLDFDDCFSFQIQMIWVYHWQYVTLFTRLMFAFYYWNTIAHIFWASASSLIWWKSTEKPILKQS